MGNILPPSSEFQTPNQEPFPIRILGISAGAEKLNCWKMPKKGVDLTFYWSETMNPSSGNHTVAIGMLDMIQEIKLVSFLYYVCLRGFHIIVVILQIYNLL